jgi:hypothetical protein
MENGSILERIARRVYQEQQVKGVRELLKFKRKHLERVKK